MKKLFLAALLFSLSVCAFAQQDYVGRYDFFTGFSYLNSPKLDLQQRGFNTQIGVNLRRWLAFGFDYSIQEGRARLVPADLKPQYATLLNRHCSGRAGWSRLPGFPAACRASRAMCLRTLRCHHPDVYRWAAACLSALEER